MATKTNLQRKLTAKENKVARLQAKLAEAARIKEIETPKLENVKFKGVTKIQECLVQRKVYTEEFVDEDTGEVVSIERTMITHVDGKPVNQLYHFKHKNYVALLKH